MTGVDDINKALERVIDPETGQSVVQMRMIKELRLDAGHCHVAFEPTSPVCPLVFVLSKNIISSILEVNGVEKVSIKVLNHIHSAAIEELFNS